jgi:hypothetical protein
LIGGLRSLFKTKFTHVQVITYFELSQNFQYAARRLVAVLSREPWIDFVLSRYSLIGENILDVNNYKLKYLTQKDLLVSVRANKLCALSAILTCELCVEGLNRVLENKTDRANLSFLLDETIFEKLLKHILISIKHIDEVLLNWSNLISIVNRIIVSIIGRVSCCLPKVKSHTS